MKHGLVYPLFDHHDAFVWLVIHNNEKDSPQPLHVEAGKAGEGTRWANVTHEEMAEFALSSVARVKRSLKKLEQGGKIEVLEPLALTSRVRYRTRKAVKDDD